MKTQKRLTKVPTAKVQALRQSGTLHRRPGNVQDWLFLEESFFDPQDLTQVKYEMLRRVQKDEMPISAVAASFGISPAGFLQGPAGLRARRPGGPNSPTTRTETRPQVDRGSSGVREAYPHSGAGYDNAGASAKNSEEVFLPGAPQDRGASTGKRGNDHTLALVRLVLGIIFFMHGAQKTLA